MAVRIVEVTLTPQITTVGYIVDISVKVSENNWQYLKVTFGTWRILKETFSTWLSIYNH